MRSGAASGLLTSLSEGEREPPRSHVMFLKSPTGLYHRRGLDKDIRTLSACCDPDIFKDYCFSLSASSCCSFLCDFQGRICFRAPLFAGVFTPANEWASALRPPQSIFSPPQALFLKQEVVKTLPGFPRWDASLHKSIWVFFTCRGCQKSVSHLYSATFMLLLNQ